MKNLEHMSSIHEAALELHKKLLGLPWYISTQVLSLPPRREAVTDKKEQRWITVYVRTQEDTKNGMTTFNSWPVHYEVGV